MIETKVKITYDDVKKTSLFINGYDLSNAPITSIDFKIKACEKPRVLIEFDADELEVEGDFEVLKKIKKGKKNIDLKNNNVFNISPDAEKEIINKLKEKVLQDFERAYKGRKV